ncbi:MAG: PEP-CTERM sorting domain-containing protein [Phycisphaeraceae bacterium]
MPNNTSHCLLACALAATTTLALPANGGEIDFLTWSSGVASVAGEAVATTSPGNDDVGGPNGNILTIAQKDYTAIGPVDIILSVSDNGNGTTEYWVREGVFNNTGLDWTGYRIVLGFGSGVGFVQSTIGDGLKFDNVGVTPATDFNPSPGWPTVVSPTEDELVASGAIVPDFTYVGEIDFHVDVPDGISTFTIRQQPIPEPSSAALLLLTTGLLMRRRRS